MHNIINKPSPNFNERAISSPSMILLHATQMPDAIGALERLCDKKSGVSAHFLIDKKGVVYSLVDVSKRAWHAGESYWHGETDINSQSIGIELDNMGEPYAEPQLVSLEKLLRRLCAEYEVEPCQVWGHSDVAPHRKEDPGAHFPWKHFADVGFGVWPSDDQVIRQDYSPSKNQNEAKDLLRSIGYKARGNDAYPLDKILSAFQQHFVPQYAQQTDCTGQLDALTWRTLQSMARGKASNFYLKLEDYKVSSILPEA